MLHRRIRRRQREGSLPGFSPGRVGWQETSSNKIIQEQEEVCRTPNSERGTPAHRQTATGRKSERHHAEVRSRQDVLGATPGVFTAQINQTFAFRGQLVSVSFECWGDFIGTDEDWSPSLRPAPLWANNTCRIRLPPPIRARPRADGRRAWPIDAHGSPWEPPSPAFPPPSAAATRSRVRTKVLKRFFKKDGNVSQASAKTRGWAVRQNARKEV